MWSFIGIWNTTNSIKVEFCFFFSGLAADGYKGCWQPDGRVSLDM